MIIKFKCPQCGCTTLAEVMSNVIETSSISQHAVLDADHGLLIDYVNTSHEGGDLENFECNECGQFIASDSQLLLGWLADHDMIELEPGETLSALKVHGVGTCHS